MKNIFLILILAQSFMVVNAGTPGTAKLPLDGGVVTGKLPNGMTYYIKHNENPAQRADFFIAHHVGAFQEEENQNGLAHFLEHMAFKGSKHFPGNGMLEYLASNGVRFGYNVNAFTSRDRTVYNISNVPLIRDGLVDSALLILHDWSSFISCLPEDIETERGVIREEMRRGNDPRSRIEDNTNKVIHNNSKYVQHDVIGNIDVINNFERQTLIDFYRKWYRPDLQAVIVVGDFDPAVMEAKIKRIFSDIPASVNPAPKSVYTTPRMEGITVATITDPATTAVAAKRIFIVQGATLEERPCESSLAVELYQDVFLTMLSERLTATAKSDTVAYKTAIAVMGGQTAGGVRRLMITIMPRNENNLYGSFADLETELERVRRYGFEKSEFDDAKSQVATKRRSAFKKLEQADNTQLARMYMDHFTDNVPYMTAADVRSATERILKDLDYGEMQSMVDGILEKESSFFFFNLPEKKVGLAAPDHRLLAMVDSVSSAHVKPFSAAASDDAVLFDKKLAGGRIVGSKDFPLDGTVEWRLSNGARVIWKAMEETEGSVISMQAYNRGGFNRSENPGQLKILANYLRSMGIGGLDKDKLRKKLAQDNISIAPTLSYDYSSFTGYASKKENMETMFQMMYLYITEPDFSEPNFTKVLNNMKSSLERTMPDKQAYADTLAKVKYGGHPWSRPLTAADVEKANAASMEAAYGKLFGNAADFTFYLAGKADVETVRGLVEKYIGSLPSFGNPSVVPDDRCEILPGVRELKFHADGTVTPKASIEIYYHGDFEPKPENYAVLKYLTYVYGGRLMKSVREEKGGTYYIGVKESVREEPNGYCTLLVSFQTDPALSDMLAEQVEKDFESLMTGDMNEKEINEALLYFRKVYDERKEKQLKAPSYWTGRMLSCDRTGNDIEADEICISGSVTAKDIQNMAKSIGKQGNRLTIMYIE